MGLRKTWFPLDLITLIPFDLIGMVGDEQALADLKTIKALTFHGYTDLRFDAGDSRSALAEAYAATQVLKEGAKRARVEQDVSACFGSIGASRRP